MSVSTLTSSTAVTAASPIGHGHKTRRTPSSDDGSNAGSGNNLLDAITKALASLGVTNNAATKATTSTGSSTGTAATGSVASTTDAGSASGTTAASGDPAQALGTFFQSLLTALHAQGGGKGGGGGSRSDGDGDDGGSTTAATSATSASAGAKAFQGSKGLSADLQSLIQQLDSAGSTTSTDSTSNSTSNSTTGNLDTSFKNLLSALGDSTSKTTLGQFLQALSSQSQGSGSTGNVINTQA